MNDSSFAVSIRKRALPLVLAFVVPAALLAQQGKPSQYDVKAAYLLNFAKFVQWPTNAEPTFRICVIGNDPFGETLDNTVKGEVLNGKPVVVKHVSADKGSSCDIAYISDSEQKRLPSLLPALASEHVLTVSDIAHFVDKGGMIGFTLESNRVRFEVNQSVAQRAGLGVSSQLLKVASLVRQDRDLK